MPVALTGFSRWLHRYGKWDPKAEEQQQRQKQQQQQILFPGAYMLSIITLNGQMRQGVQWRALRGGQSGKRIVHDQGQFAQSLA